MLRGVLTVGGWTMASRIAGFARDILIAAMAGTGPVADAFFMANKLPNLFRKLFGEGAFNTAFVPEFAGLLASEGPRSAQSFAEEAFSVLAFWLAGLTILGEIFMPAIMTVLAPGFSDEPAKFALAIGLARITFPYLFLICLAALLSGVLNGLDRFVAAAAAPLLYNLFSIAAMLLLTPYLPTVGHALAWGVSLSGVAQLALLVWAVARGGMALRIPRPRLTPQMRLLMRRMAPSLVGAGVTQLNLAVDMIIGSLLPAGSVSLLYYADRVNQLPLGVIGTAVGTALLPMLSRQVRSGETKAADDTMNRGLEYALLLTLPAALALGVTAVPIIYVLFGHGAFTYQSALGSAAALTAYAIGLPAFVVVKVLVPGFFARGDTATPVKIGFFTLALNFTLNLLLMQPLQQVGPALATSIAASVNCVLLGVVLARQGHLRFDRRLLARVPRMLLAALAMGLVLWGAELSVYAALDTGRGLRTLGLALLIGLGLAAYGLSGQVLGAFDLRELTGTLLRRPRRLANTG
jgi:putative peptidoglycan lipid II flippase